MSATYEDIAPEDDQNVKKTDHGETLFTPPLYIQRYSRVSSVLEERKVSSVVDFGAAECKFLRFLKEIDNMESITAVDIDEELLRSKKHLLRPRPSDYTFRRKKEMTMKLMAGSVSQYDPRLKNIDAVTMIELIEHLEDPILQSFPENVFGILQPRIVVITTPNSEYNVVFENFTGMRHWDHKFEWTRQEFINWCNGVIQKYPYTVEFSGIGEPPPNKECVGFCSQMAIFTRSSSERNIQDGNVSVSEDMNDRDQNTYVLIEESSFPYDDKTLPLENQILYHAECYVRGVGFEHEFDQDDETEDGRLQMLVSLEKILAYPKVNTICKDLDKLRDILKGSRYPLSADENSVIFSNSRVSSVVSDEELVTSDYEDWDNGMQTDMPSSELTNVKTQEESWEEELENIDFTKPPPPLNGTTNQGECPNLENLLFGSLDQPKTEKACQINAHTSHTSNFCSANPLDSDDYKMINRTLVVEGQFDDAVVCDLKIPSPECIDKMSIGKQTKHFADCTVDTNKKIVSNSLPEVKSQKETCPPSKQYGLDNTIWFSPHRKVWPMDHYHFSSKKSKIVKIEEDQFSCQ